MHQIWLARQGQPSIRLGRPARATFSLQRTAVGRGRRVLPSTHPGEALASLEGEVRLPRRAKALALVRTEVPSPNSATTPNDSCWVMISMIVTRNIASSCHALLEISTGTWTNQRMTLVVMEARRGFMAALCHG
ncbi:uncharacterized protein J3R85_011240 [Psidium guajava]|nr:uncharacterized protein J3R85_011240 [Psidium guajava]